MVEISLSFLICCHLFNSIKKFINVFENAFKKQAILVVKDVRDSKLLSETQSTLGGDGMQFLPIELIKDLVSVV